MTSRRVLGKNPYEEMPTFLIWVAERILLRHSLSDIQDKDILLLVREISALFPHKPPISEREACKLVKEAVGWRVSYRAEKKYKPGGAAPHTPACRVARTDYCLPKTLFPARRYVPDSRSDPLEQAGRWRNALEASGRIKDLTGRWWGRMWRLAFREPLRIQPWVVCYMAPSPVVRSGNRHINASELTAPFPVSKIITMDVSKGFLRRLRAAGLRASDGFLPIDAIVDDDGRVTRVIAFRRHGDAIFLESLTPEDLTDLTT